MSNTCYATKIPELCSGGLVVTVSSGGTACIPTENPQIPGAYTYTGSAVYNIGKLRSVLPGYNPANTILAAFNFTNADLQIKWVPAVYQVFSGTTTLDPNYSGGYVSSGIDLSICYTSYNTEEDPHWLISWHEPAMRIGAGISSNATNNSLARGGVSLDLDENTEQYWH